LLALKPLPRLSHQIFTLDEEADALKRIPTNSRLSARRANTLQRIPTYRRFVFTLQRALPAAVVACLILALLLVFGIQIATKNASLPRSEEHTSELQSPYDLVCRLLLEKKKKKQKTQIPKQKKHNKQHNTSTQTT